MTDPGLTIDQRPDGSWYWIYQTPTAGFYTSGTSYTTKTLARKAGQHWLARRANPRNRGR